MAVVSANATVYYFSYLLFYVYENLMKRLRQSQKNLHNNNTNLQNKTKQEKHKELEKSERKDLMIDKKEKRSVFQCHDMQCCSILMCCILLVCAFLGETPGKITEVFLYLIITYYHCYFYSDKRQGFTNDQTSLTL